ncbi:head fiber protein [Serratia proteamaculans]
MLWQTLPKQFIEDYPMPKRVVGASGVPVTVADMSDIAGGGDITSSQITDATTVGKAVLTATDAAAARTAIGAGAPYTLPAATTSVNGGVKKMPAQADSTATDAAGAVTDFNALLAKLRTAGLLS